MSPLSVRARAGQDRTSLYDDITNTIIAELEAGRLPWIQPWGSSTVSAPLAMPKNAATGRGYSGINVLILWGAVVQHGFPTQSWLTYRQALGLGGHVRKGERGTTVVYADRFIPDDERRRSRETGDEAVAIPFLKRFTVFNVAQCDGLPNDLVTVPPPVPDGLIIPEVEALIRASGADLRLGGDKAFYAPAPDYIQLPRPESYFEPINWHRTALHELGHWTGHASRLARDLSGAFGSKLYSREELVAEMTSAFCCATLGIVPTVRHADYIAAWLEVLRQDKGSLWARQVAREDEDVAPLHKKVFEARADLIWRTTTAQARRGHFAMGVGLEAGLAIDAMADELAALLDRADKATLNGDVEELVDALGGLGERLLFMRPFIPDKASALPVNWKASCAGRRPVDREQWTAPT
jgi:antirestriction protein ArdC